MRNFISTRTLTSRFALLLLAVGSFSFAASFATAQTPPTDHPQPAAPPATPSAPAPATEDPKPDDSAPLAYALMKTSKGDIVLELNREKAPISVANFLKYAADDYYEDTVFHRVIAGFMIQGGGYTEDIQPKPGLEPAIKNEWQNGLKNLRGTVAMARLGGRADSATSQFFINVVDNAFLDEPRDGAGYAVFGKVVAGMKVVDEIRFVSTGFRNGMGDVPLEPVTIEGVKQITKEEADKLIEAEKPGTIQPPTPDSPPTAPRPGGSPKRPDDGR